MKKKLLIIGSIFVFAIILGFAAIVIFTDTSRAAFIENIITQVDAENTEEEGQEIADKSYDFINENPNIFPTMNFTEVEPFINKDFRAKDMDKNLDKQSGQLFENYGRVYDIFEVKWSGFEDGEDKLVTYLFVEDNEGYSYELFYLDETEIEQGDEIKFVALPLISSNYTNTSGGTTRVFLNLASYIE